MTSPATTSTAPDEARTRNHEQAKALRSIADFLDAHPNVEPISSGPIWVFASDAASAVAWREFLGNPRVDIDPNGYHKARCEVTVGGLRIILAIDDRVALTKPVPTPAPQLAEWLQ